MLGCDVTSQNQVKALETRLWNYSGSCVTIVLVKHVSTMTVTMRRMRIGVYSKMATFLKIIDYGMRTLLYSKYTSILGLESVNKGVILCPKEIALREKAEKEGNPELEFVNIWRTKTAFSWKRQRTPMARRGVSLEYDDAVAKNSVVTAKAVPVDLAYDVWFWSLKKERINEIDETYLFWQHVDPNLNLLYMDTYPANLDLHFSELTDESTVSTKYQTGMYFVRRATIVVDGWVFISEDVPAIHNIHLVIFDRDNVEDYSELIEEDSNYDAELAETLKLYERWES